MFIFCPLVAKKRFHLASSDFEMAKYFFKDATDFTEVPQSEAEADAEALLPSKRNTARSWTSALCSPLCLLTGLSLGWFLGSGYESHSSPNCVERVSAFCKCNPPDVVRI